MRAPETTTGTMRLPLVSLSSSGTTSGRSLTFTSENDAPWSVSLRRMLAQYGHPVFTYRVMRSGMGRPYHAPGAPANALAPYGLVHDGAAVARTATARRSARWR